MSELVIIGYDDETTATNVLDELQDLQRDYLIDLEDAAVLIRNQRGKVRTITADHAVSAGTVTGMFWGTLIGLLFLAPIAGFAIGGLVGAASGGIARLDLKEDFKRQFADLVQPGTSAVMVIVRRANTDRILEEFKPYGGTVLKTSLSEEAEEHLMDELYGKERRGAA